MSDATLHAGNRARLAASYLAGVGRPSGRPAHLKIELTNACNLRCPLCPHPRMERAQGMMSPSLLARIVEMAAPELEFAYLHHLGESLLHPALGEMIAIAKSRGAAVGLSTNGTLLDGERSAALLDGGLDLLVISLDAASEATYAAMRPPRRVGATSLAAVTGRIEAFLVEREIRARAGGRPLVSVQMLVTPKNAPEADAFVARWHRPERGVAVMLKEPRDWAGAVPLVPPPSTVGRGRCRMPWTELTILWDGRVVPCANHAEAVNVLGDLTHQTLDEVWNGPAMRALRAAHARGDAAAVPVCARCPGHVLDGDDFVAVDQLAQRRRTYIEGGTTLRAGLS
jgi:radical SAM protein with 4Fe4S-binding SPASM domain